MTARRNRRAPGALAVVAWSSLIVACSTTTGDNRGTTADRLEFIDGPADHLAGAAIPQFRIWVIDPFGGRATGLPDGTMSLELLGPGGAILDANFATVPVSFGQAVVSPAVTLDEGDGYAVRANLGGLSQTSPIFSAVSAPDRIVFEETRSAEVGLLVDGANNVQSLFDNVFKTTSSSVAVGVFDSGALTQSVAVFGPDRRPELLPVSWSPSVDTLMVPVRDPIALPVTVWIVSGGFAEGQASVGAALADLSAAWTAERAGIVIGDVQYMDASAFEEDWSIFALGIGAPFAPIAGAVGRAAGRFNIYLVDEVRVDEAPVDGFAENFGTAMALPAGLVTAEGAPIPGHQFGHNFGLQDKPEVQGFLADPNVMAVDQYSTVMTEGQIFRVHFSGPSPVRALRDGDTFGNVVCESLAATTHCPELSFRIWNEADPATAVSPRR